MQNLLAGLDPDTLGEQVRIAWVRNAEARGDAPPHHLTPWAELDAQNKQVDREIGTWLLHHIGERLIAITEGRAAEYAEKAQRKAEPGTVNVDTHCARSIAEALAHLGVDLRIAVGTPSPGDLPQERTVGG